MRSLTHSTDWALREPELFDFYRSTLQRHRPFLQWLCLRFAPEERRQELMQELVMAFHEVLLRRGPGRLGDGYLCNTWRKRAVDFLRRDRRHLPLEAALQLPDSEAASQEERQALLQELFALLSEEERRVVEAYLEADGCTKEAAQSLGLAPNTFAVRMHRLIKRLQNQLNLNVL